MKKLPVILDTDIGDDIDDIWALDMLVKSPELAPKLVVSALNNTRARAALIAKYLAATGNTAVPVGIGKPGEQNSGSYFQWASQADLTGYKGKVYEDGVQAAIDIIKKSRETVTIIAIGPLPNIAEMLKRDPAIAPKTRLVAMSGCLAHAFGKYETIPEYNVRKDTLASQAVYSAPWKEFITTPTDTCSYVRLRGERYQRIKASQDAGLKSVLEAYNIWITDTSWPKKHDTAIESSILFDTVAVHLAYSKKYLKFESINIAVDDKGCTRHSDRGLPVKVAYTWEDQDAYEEYLMKRLLAKSEKKHA